MRSGGEGGIRTLGTLAGSTVFETAPTTTLEPLRKGTRARKRPVDRSARLAPSASPCQAPVLILSRASIGPFSVMLGDCAGGTLSGIRVILSYGMERSHSIRPRPAAGSRRAPRRGALRDRRCRAPQAVRFPRRGVRHRSRLRQHEEWYEAIQGAAPAPRPAVSTTARRHEDSSYVAYVSRRTSSTTAPPARSSTRACGSCSTPSAPVATGCAAA